MKLLAVLCLVCCAYASVLPPKRLVKDESDTFLSTPEIIEKYGYPSETYEVQTDDGYLLTLHRIPYGVKCGADKSKGPILVQHGLFCSSADWVYLGPEHGLGFILADNCYDVWLGNNRGNHYSRKHISLDPSDSDFWSFSWHHMGQYDLPTMINFILHKTGKEKLVYAGHSEGTTQFFVGNSLDQSLGDKVKGMVAMAPIAFMKHSNSGVLQFISLFQAELNWVSQWIGMDEFMPTDGFIDKVGRAICRDTHPGLEKLCENILFLACGFDSEQLNATDLAVILGHTPAGASTKQLLHYAQSLNHGHFKQFNHGTIKNLIIYGQPNPPTYELDKLNVPIHLIYSQNDWLAAVKDVETLIEKISYTLAGEPYVVPLEKFNHLDYMWAIDVYDLVYGPMIEKIDSWQ